MLYFLGDIMLCPLWAVQGPAGEPQYLISAILSVLSLPAPKCHRGGGHPSYIQKGNESLIKGGEKGKAKNAGRG